MLSVCFIYVFLCDFLFPLLLTLLEPFGLSLAPKRNVHATLTMQISLCGTVALLVGSATEHDKVKARTACSISATQGRAAAQQTEGLQHTSSGHVCARFISPSVKFTLCYCHCAFRFPVFRRRWSSSSRCGLRSSCFPPTCLGLRIVLRTEEAPSK